MLSDACFQCRVNINGRKNESSALNDAVVSDNQDARFNAVLSKSVFKTQLTYFNINTADPKELRIKLKQAHYRKNNTGGRRGTLPLKHVNFEADDF